MTAGDSRVLGGVTGTKVRESRDVAVVKDGTAHRAPGLGRQNRKQHLGEYAAERGVVFGFAASAAVSSSVGGQTKRARGVGVGGSGGPYSDEMDEDGMETESEMGEEDKEDMDINALVACVTIVFEDALREATLHPRPLLPTAACLSPRARKHQRIDDDDHDDPMHTMADGANTNEPVRRGVELETAVERFLLRMYKADSDNGTDAGNEDAGSADKTKTLAEDQQQQSGGEQSDRRWWEIWLLSSLDNDKDTPPPPPFSMLDGEDGATKEGTAIGGAMLLQHGLRASNLKFVEGEGQNRGIIFGAVNPSTFARSEGVTEGVLNLGLSSSQQHFPRSLLSALNKLTAISSNITPGRVGQCVVVVSEFA
ncbi:hypothetical protein BJV78DRAFT_1364651 [Lactifluus subvellereus]|nr:hypothetical protein BJV78DRAFT_1364651 [Lactifluus subvellereus]